jgi:hypothetical protein
MRRLQKLSDLEPCMNSSCRGALTRGFVVLHMSHGLINGAAANQVLGLNQMFGGGPQLRALRLAEAFAPADPVIVFGDKDPSLYVTVILCQECWLMNDFNLAHLFDIASRRSSAGAGDDAKGAAL